MVCLYRFVQKQGVSGKVYFYRMVVVKGVLLRESFSSYLGPKLALDIRSIPSTRQFSSVWGLVLCI